MRSIGRVPTSSGQEAAPCAFSKSKRATARPSAPGSLFQRPGYSISRLAFRHEFAELLFALLPAERKLDAAFCQTQVRARRQLKCPGRQKSGPGHFEPRAPARSFSGRGTRLHVSPSAANSPNYCLRFQRFAPVEREGGPAACGASAGSRRRRDKKPRYEHTTKIEACHPVTMRPRSLRSRGPTFLPGECPGPRTGRELHFLRRSDFAPRLNREGSAECDDEQLLPNILELERSAFHD